MQNPYDYDKALAWLEQRGRQIYGDHFTIPDKEKPLVKKLVPYFVKDEAAATLGKMIHSQECNTPHILGQRSGHLS